MSKGYNGWANRATWNVALRVGSDLGLYNWVESNKPYSKAKAKRVAEELFGDKTPDGCKLDGVNWKEIADAWNE